MSRLRPWLSSRGLRLLVTVAILLVLLAWLGMEHVFNLLEWLERRVERNYWAALALFSLAFVGLILTTLPVGTIFCLAGGYFFGLVTGATAALLAGTLGAFLTYALVRQVGGQRVREHFSRSRLEPWMLLLERDATWYLILLRIVPIAPFFVVNAAAGMTRIAPLHFLIATLVGLIPTSVIYAAVGRGLESASAARDLAGPRLLLEPEVGLPLLGLVGILVISWIVHRHMGRRSEPGG